MNSNNLAPSREEAENIFLWAYEKNPEPWAKHCRAVARVAEEIALKSDLNPEKAYIFGLFHDIGYYAYESGKGSTCHIYFGYELMMEKGYETAAKICLTHSFPIQDFTTYSGSDMYCNDEQKTFITSFLSEAVYDDYDKLIMLSDCLGTAQGIVTMDKRNIDIVMRKGFNENTLKVWSAYYGLKDYFDKKCGMNIYNLFFNEIKNSTFGL